jgi:uncharacterized protein (TIGR03382 family)
MNRRNTVALIVAVVGTMAGLTSCGALGEVIQLRSGQVSGVPGLAGQNDDIVTWGVTNFSGPLSASPFTTADFNATTPNPAVVINPVSVWIPGLTSDPQARWIGTSTIPGSNGWGATGSTLYRVPFNVTTVGITSATLNVAWSSDDSLGDLAFGGANPVGAYIRNGFGAITPLTPVAGGNFTIESIVSGLNVTGAISTGANELFFYQRDQGFGVSGVIFSAEFNIIPTPGAAALLGLGGLSMARRRR